MAVGKGFYIILQDNKYDLIPNTGSCPEALAFAETTEEIHDLLVQTIWSKLLLLTGFNTFATELDKLSNFPLVQRDMISFYKLTFSSSFLPHQEDGHELR